MSVRSDEIKHGVARAPHRSLLRALGVSDAEMERPFVGIANSFSDNDSRKSGCFLWTACPTLETRIE